MKIAVCIKRVPDSETRVKIAADGTSLDEAGVKFILNPYDEFAVEEALRRKEKAGAGEVVLFFFSSRRRHTRCYRDWSSDVCSSDLAERDVLEPGDREVVV